ncbi:dihydrodipicolinate synthase family protein [Saccharolobus solfataricus]|uniref:Dihydrodipicolinate synthase (DapA-2) n=3 Tax=Saccharolobus solfataricus TaxID=2287 RepID=Q97UI2_SACS2|nr:dihydrodipicolinate synthase family protein [Saccharolobus solfataricus]AET42955.1 dihydrodipicolinate synthase-like protein [Saccharolobus solfataricus 98/2]AAK43137.1 Dihydrodipicolinate synthase (dapA-2) [Saccharolobus solfataricus P2]AKA73180.1 dihydrodipicolinate synthase family protein [Saccharolobus solfataricus]AKA75878.1 dihydrodipicolinate synthase family protein [Saccharolobus solfataricus]AKA78570.1 dihydrodipicolinate synthase family protein [Saccharolobus solfataricus]
MDGVFLTNVTPFTKTLELDLEGLKRIVEFAQNSGYKYIVPLGTAGEFSSLTVEEKVRVVDHVRRALSKGEIIAGASSTSFLETGELCKKYKEIGVDKIMVLPPYYLKGNEKGLMEYFFKVAELCDSTMVLYNNPSSTGVDLSPQLIKRLNDMIPSFRVLKEARYNVVEFKEVVRLVGDKIDVIDGLEERALLGLVLGAKGFTTSMGSFSSLPLMIYESYEKKRNIDTAIRLYDLLLEYRSFIKLPLTMSHLAKLGAWLRGLISSYATRPPLPNLDDVVSEDVKRKMIEKINQIISFEKNTIE